MVFGKIEYLNLLPFHIFMKRFTKSTQQKMSMDYYSGVPSVVNEKFIKHKVDAAFISSIRAKRYNNVNLGIIAKKEVKSVIVIPSEEDKKDVASATSNILAKVLKVNGEVLIGDRALKYYLSGKEHIDLAKVWNGRYNLPFVFALLCIHKDKQLYKNIEKNFLKRKVKIPTYLLEKASKRTNISKRDILNYLEYISYDFNKKAQLGLKTFYKKSSHLKV